MVHSSSEQLLWSGMRRGCKHDGHLRGVATQLESDHPAALKVHCLARTLNLCLQGAAKKCQPCSWKCMDIVMEVLKLILYSTKHSLVFSECKKEFTPGGTGLQPLCPTQWTVRTRANSAFLRNYAALLQAVNKISEESYDDYG